MKKKYKEIQFGAGETIESAMKHLSQFKDELVCASFNDKMLYSDIDDLNSAYKKITGKSKIAFDKAAKKENDKYKANQQKHKDSIPDLTKEWIKKGKKVLDKKYQDYWNKIVPIRLGDLYQGMELGACLEIVEALNKDCELEIAKKIIEDQGHSGMSHGLVCSMVRAFCDRGNEFVNYIK